MFVSISPVGFAVGKCQHKYGIKTVWSASWCRFFKMEEIKYRFQMVSTRIKHLFIFFSLSSSKSYKRTHLLSVSCKSAEYSFFLTFFARVSYKLFTGQWQRFSKEHLGFQYNERKGGWVDFGFLCFLSNSLVYSTAWRINLELVEFLLRGQVWRKLEIGGKLRFCCQLELS